MQLKITCRNAGKRALIEAATTWIAQELKIREKNFALTIVSRRGMVKEDGARGMAYIIQDKNYIVTFDSGLNFDTMIRTLCHEMVHVKQFVRGQYRTEIKRGRLYHFWNGTKYYNPKYHEAPWEIDAASKESLLALKLNGLMCLSR
jgi:hypothetical protein